MPLNALKLIHLIRLYACTTQNQPIQLMNCGGIIRAIASPFFFSFLHSPLQYTIDIFNFLLTSGHKKKAHLEKIFPAMSSGTNITKFPKPRIYNCQLSL